MKSKQIMLLLAAAVLLVGLAFWSGKRRQPPVSRLSGAALLPDLDVNAIAAIEIESGAGALKLARLNDRWCVTNAFNYPADFSRLSQRLLALRDVKIGQIQRGMAITAADATRVRFQDVRGNTLAELALGAGRQAKGGESMGYYQASDGRYLSRNGEPPVFLVKESLDEWNADPEGWLDSQIVSISPGDIATIEMRSAGGEPVVLDRLSGTLALVGLDAEKEIFESSRASGVDSALNYLRFTRIADPALPPDQSGFATGSLYRVTLKSGDIYTGTVGAAEAGDRYFKLAVELPPATTNDAVRATAEVRVAEANARLKPWTFLIASHAAGNLVRTRAELVSPKPAETNAVGNAEAPAQAEPDGAKDGEPADAGE